MPDLETRLRHLRRSADATVFAGVQVSPELKARVLKAAQESAAQAPTSRTSLDWPTHGRRHAGYRTALRLAGVAALVGLAALVAVEVWPSGGRAVAASLTVRPAGSPFVVSVRDPHVRAVGGEVVTLPVGPGVETVGVGVEALPVELDATSSLTYRWSPDGRRLVYGNRGDLFVYDAETGAVRNVTRTPKRWELLPSWSPDGTRLAFTSRALAPGEGPNPDATDDPDWVMVGVFGGSPTVVGAQGDGYRVLDEVAITSAPSWSSDGHTLAYAADGIVEADVPETKLNRRDGVVHLADVASGGVRRLTPSLGLGGGYIGAPSWSPTRRELAVFFSESDRFPGRDEVLSNTAPRVRQGYALLDLASGDVAVLYSYQAPFVPRGPATWSDDGELLALNFRQETAIGDPVELVVVSRTGTRELRLPGLFAQVVWEPGERRLAARDDSAVAGVILVTVGEEGASTQRLRFNSEIEGLAWRPAER